MNILESQQQILSFCMIPRTSSEIATMLGLKRNSIYPMLNNLVLSKELKKTGNKKDSLTFLGSPGRKVAYIIEDTVFQNIYATEETDVEKLENMFVKNTQCLLEEEI